MEQPASSSGKFLSRLRGQKGEQKSGEQQQQQKQKQEPKKLNQMTKRFSRSSSSKTAKSKKTPAHQVLIGRGGTTNTFFPHPGHIAFTSLDNGVGVFFKIDYNRCFAAHIYARVHEAAAVVVVPGGAASSSAPDVVASRDQALRYIAREVGQKLEYECAAASWLQRSSKAVMRRSLRLVAHGADGARESLDAAVRMAVADGVRRWLGMVEEMGRPLGQGRAFVVDGMGGEVERQDGELGEERWDLVPVKAKVGGWRIRVGVQAAEQQ
ncbi:hypothetical protein KC332_g2063 [Hortaea werneckii]|nr:hypothetical protein KC358_g12309 [Hortaea werneckii]KAI6835348.1 hypothetical protein KC350_g6531 [Hortaea werneckii]KAI6936681.1 hypothetical protein KC348_g5928 [Hortaea werneckii]KAI6939161.1 hypothetical protein KC341_g4370 [Hortaea werneckii]KAI6980375.1 hypothetical protein KC321_g1818 [Hortaea werneckii]